MDANQIVRHLRARCQDYQSLHRETIQTASSSQWDVIEFQAGYSFLYGLVAA